MAAAGKRGRSDVEFDVDEFLASTEQQGTTLDSMVLGIDEAGRGPVLGDMVYGGAMVTLREHNRIVDTGATDSKALTEAARESIREKLSEIPNFHVFEKPLSPEDIGDAMFSRNGRNLNTISHETAIAIIAEATEVARGKLSAVYVDTVGLPEPYQRMLQGRFPHLNITVAKKADAKFPIVSAASIFAKTTRDRSIAKLAAKFGPLGSGYPGDAATVAFLRSHVHRFFTFTPEYDHVRQSWGPVVAIARTSCVKVAWQHEEENQSSRVSKNQPRLDEANKTRRDIVYAQNLGVHVTAAFPQ